MRIALSPECHPGAFHKAPAEIRPLAIHRDEPPKTLMMQYEELHQEYPDVPLDLQSAERGLGWGYQHEAARQDHEREMNFLEHFGEWLHKK